MNIKSIGLLILRVCAVVLAVGAIVYPWFWLPDIIQAIGRHGIADSKVMRALIAFLIIALGALVLAYVLLKYFWLKRKAEPQEPTSV